MLFERISLYKNGTVKYYKRYIDHIAVLVRIKYCGVDDVVVKGFMMGYQQNGVSDYFVGDLTVVY